MIPIPHITKKTIESVSKPQDKNTQVKARDAVSVCKETKSNEKPTNRVMKSIFKPITEGVKEKKKDVSPKTSLKNNVMQL